MAGDMALLYIVCITVINSKPRGRLTHKNQFLAIYPRIAK